MHASAFLPRRGSPENDVIVLLLKLQLKVFCFFFCSYIFRPAMRNILPSVWNIVYKRMVQSVSKVDDKVKRDQQPLCILLFFENCVLET